MYRALIVDDEKHVRQVIQTLGNWKELGIGEVLEAADGRSALNMIRISPPNIVLLDMNMPLMKGNEFLQLAYTEFPEIKFIIVSGYDDFGFIRQAIQSRALDYLLKPVSEEELNIVLRKAIQELDEDLQKKILYSNMDQLHNVSIPMAKEKIIQSLIFNQAKPYLLDEHKKILGIEGDAHIYGVSLLWITNFDVLNEQFACDNQITYYAITNVLNEILAEWGQSFSVHNPKLKNEIIIFLIIPSNRENQAGQLVQTFLTTALNVLERFFGAYSFASVGSLSPNFSEIAASYKEAEKIRNNVNILKTEGRIFTKLDEASPPYRISFVDHNDQLINAFRYGSQSSASEIIHAFYDELETLDYLKLEDLYRITKGIMEVLNYLTGFLKISENLDLLGPYYERISATPFTQLDEFQGFVLDILGNLSACKNNLQNDYEKNNLQEIKDYIDQFYYRDIKLTTFSERYYMDKKYLSKLFKDKYGYSIYEYVLNLRMRKAKEMLSDLDIKIQTIAEFLNYRNSNYFSNAFKNYYRISPSEYRESL